MWFFLILFLLATGVPRIVRYEMVYTSWGMEYRPIPWQYYELDLVVVFAGIGLLFTLCGVEELPAGLCACGTVLLADVIKDRKWWHYEFE